MSCAHINPISLKEQSVKEHSYNVSQISKKFGAKILLDATAELAGSLHDLGKETQQFDAYIHYSSLHPEDKSHRRLINHSTAGAKFIYDSFYNTSDQYQKLTAQLISMVICSHHGGLIDCLDLNGNDIFSKRMETDKEIFYEEALANFLAECLSLTNINELFIKSKQEIKAVISKINQIDNSPRFRQFAAGMLEKYLFSCVVDADRYDTYNFMEGRDLEAINNRESLWEELADCLDNKLDSYPQTNKIDRLRKEISISCKDFAKNKPGIYQLSVPTGGGKTLSSLRYALEHARQFKKDRIFYVIPFTTIIDQNAKVIKEILEHEDIILEHHSNLLADQPQEYYQLLTERWDSPIILTTMVQFLNTLFDGGTQHIRRMHNLANAVIIFDEIQAIPIKCINMFNSAINFLSYICNTSILLCTATQPLLATTAMPLKLSGNPDIISNIDEIFNQFKRVKLIDERRSGGYDTASLRDFILDKMNYVDNVLVIVNTKNAARDIFNQLKEANKILPEQKQYVVFHLSTNMCPSHRMSALQEIINLLGHARMICISTQLIEAGVDISFECVVRSLAGMDSIAQAAGRCNRHGKISNGRVYIVNVKDENVSKIPDIKEGQECSKRILDEFKENPHIFDNDLLSPKLMERYYQYYFHNRKGQMNYTLSKPDNDKSMYDLLSDNQDAVNAYRGINGHKPGLILKQAFKTAGDQFQVINQNTVSVIVPYKEGRELITLINGECSLSELKQYLKRAQQFSANLFAGEKIRLEEKGAIIGLKEGSILALREEFYNEDVGVIFEDAPMEFYDY